MDDRRAHWEKVYATRPVDQVSWFQPEATTSLRLIKASGRGPASALVDVGGGASPLSAALLANGWNDLTVVDIAAAALEAARAGFGPGAERVEWRIADVLEWRPSKRFDLWHDRAVFHFLTEPDQRARYRETLARALRPGGWMALGTFAADGPERCSGLAVQRWSAEGLEQEFGPAFALRQSLSEVHSTPGGAVQAFTWVLFERVG